MLAAFRIAAFNQLQIINHNQPQMPGFLSEPPALGPDLRHPDPGGIVNIDISFGKRFRGDPQALPFVTAKVPSPDVVGIDTALGTQHPVNQGLRPHFQAKNGDRSIIFHRHVLGNIQGKGGLPHRRPGR